MTNKKLKFSKRNYSQIPENNFQILVKHAGQSGIPVDVFEPKGQPGILVIGAKVVMKNSQISRYLGFNAEEKEKFEKKVVFRSGRLFSKKDIFFI
mgnify:CR=1 FL=1